MIGIYKITSPSSKIYIGQSVDIERRWLQHNKCGTGERKLKNSFLKYGFENHIFEVIEECDLYFLNDREAHWQDYYDSIRNGLNCRRTTSSDKSGYLSEETKRRISESRKANPDVNTKRKGVPLTEEHKKKISDANKGKIKSEDVRRKISESRKGKSTGVNHHNFGKTINEKSRKAFSERMKNLKGLDNLVSKDVIDLNTGIFYYTIHEAIYYNENLTYGGLTGKKSKNKTSCVIAEDYENNKVKIFIPKENKRNARKISDGTKIYKSIAEYSEIHNISRDKVYTKIKNKELKYE